MKSTEIRPIDIIIPFHNKDREVLRFCITSCQKYVEGVRDIYLVGKDRPDNISGVRFIHENDYFPERLMLKDIYKRWEKECSEQAGRAGWLFQQFIKLGSCYAVPDLSDSYLILDADVIWLKPVSFFSDGKILISPSQEYHQPYYDCFSRLMGCIFERKCSFVSHHFPMKKNILRGMLDKIEKRWNKVWYEAILDQLDFSESACFSEYETIGLYLQSIHPNAFILRPLRNIQSFKWKYLPLILCGAADYMTIHDYKKPARNQNTSRLLYSIFLWIIRHKLVEKIQKTSGSNGIV